MLSKKLFNDVIKMAIGIYALSLVMVLIFALLGYFDITVIFGALLGATVCILNFFFLAVTVQKSVSKEAGRAKAGMGTSYILRMLLIAVTIIAGIKLSYFNYVAVFIPFFFPRIVIMVINYFDNKKSRKGDEKI